jgi:hypothetical protein
MDQMELDAMTTERSLYIVVGVLVYKMSTHLLDGSLDSVGRKPDLEQAGHFLRFMTLMHISSSPSFASPAGKALIAEIALSAYSCARARVCSNPSVCPTISRA